MTLDIGMVYNEVVVSQRAQSMALLLINVLPDIVQFYFSHFKIFKGPRTLTWSIPELYISMCFYNFVVEFLFI